MDVNKLKEVSNKVRVDIIKSVWAAGSGHPGGSLSAADIGTYVYFEEMNIDPKNPKMEGRDKFILSKGHAGPLQYALLAERGYFDVADLMTLRKLGSKLQGHPNMHYVPGVEMSTGSLAQGFSVCVGMALANKLDKNPGRIFTLLGDGELQEGLVWEAAMAAGHYKLNNLVAIVDWNGLQIDGKNDDVMTVKPIDEKFKAFGWNAIQIDGHDFGQIKEAFAFAKASQDKPTVIVAKTVKGKGVSYMENNYGWHGKAPSDEEYETAMNELKEVK